MPRNVVGRIVEARTRVGIITARVKEQITKDQANRILVNSDETGEGRGPSFVSRSGTYLILDGLDYPIRRGRCRIVQTPDDVRKIRAAKARVRKNTQSTQVLKKRIDERRSAPVAT